ncbi:ABC transporter permease [Arthrobacter sp. SD76]|uniref:ABC transporter permease n=1 Tax=Arthrobacter sp. SD76 TaxID=3415007 RepID=UPI003C774D54
MQFIARRVGFYILTALAAITLNFFLPRMIPGDPVEGVLARLGATGSATPEMVADIRRAFGLNPDSNLFTDYIHYWGQLLTGNLGTSITFYPTPVSTVISEALPWSLGLVGVATIASFIIGTLLGVLVAAKRATRWELAIPVTTFFSAIPYFWTALMALTVFSVALGWFPVAGGYDFDTTPGWNWPFIASVLLHAALPAFTILISSLASPVLGMRNMMITTMSEDYVLVAEAKGLSARRVMLRYAARNALLPTVTGFALSLGVIVGGSVVTEVVFSYPGIGNIMFDATQQSDYPLMQGIFLIITLTVLAANLLADVLYVALDPRTRHVNA